MHYPFWERLRFRLCVFLDRNSSNGRCAAGNRNPIAKMGPMRHSSSNFPYLFATAITAPTFSSRPPLPCGVVQPHAWTLPTLLEGATKREPMDPV
jgi:hypothetical protein